MKRVLGRVVVGKQTVPIGKKLKKLKKLKKPRTYKGNECDQCDEGSEDSASDQEKYVTSVTSKYDLDAFEQTDNLNWVATADLDVYEEDFVELDNLLEDDSDYNSSGKDSKSSNRYSNDDDVNIYE